MNEWLTVYRDNKTGIRYRLELNINSQWVLARCEPGEKSWKSGLMELLMMNNNIYEYDEQSYAQNRLNERAKTNGWIAEEPDICRGYRIHEEIESEGTK